MDRYGNSYIPDDVCMMDCTMHPDAVVQLLAVDLLVVQVYAVFLAELSLIVANNMMTIRCLSKMFLVPNL